MSVITPDQEMRTDFIQDNLTRFIVPKGDICVLADECECLPIDEAF